MGILVIAITLCTIRLELDRTVAIPALDSLVERVESGGFPAWFVLHALHAALITHLTRWDI